MKIGIDVRLWGETGVGRYIRNLVINLLEVDKKNEYILFALTKDKKQIEFLVLHSKFEVVVADIHWHSLSEQMFFPLILNEAKLDLMHFPYFSVPYLYKKPFVITIHDLIIEHLPTGKASTLPLPIYMLKRQGYKKILRNAVKNAEKVIVPLETVKKDVMETLEVLDEKIVVTKEGFDASIAKGKGSRTKDIPERYFLYVGNAYPHKNLMKLIEGFELFKVKDSDLAFNDEKNKKDTHLVLVGKQDYFYEQMEKQVTEKGYTDIIFRHGVEDEELGSLYRNALALVSPSLMEGFGLLPLEAMSLECLATVSNIPSFKEVCGDSVIYFDPNSPGDIERVLQEIASMSLELRKEYISKGLKRSKIFSWNQMAKETVKVYESCLSTNSR